MSFNRIRMEMLHEGCVARLTLAAPKANILDRAMIHELDAALADLSIRDLHAIVIGADGPHFSFGASVPEHLPEQIGDTLAALHRLLRRLLQSSAPVIAAVRGQCLGGGFELALACDLILAEEGAQFGCPEIKLGVFAPAASALLPARIGVAAAQKLLLTGCSLTAAEAAATGLVARTVPANELDAALDKWLREEFLCRPTVALKHAALAARRPVLRAFETNLPDIEREYLTELMSSPDAVEGIEAFLEKRPPRWGKSAAAKSNS